MDSILIKLSDLLLKHKDVTLKVLVDTGDYEDCDTGKVYSSIRDVYLEHLTEYRGSIYSKDEIKDILYQEYYDDTDVDDIVESRISSLKFVKTIVIVLN